MAWSDSPILPQCPLTDYEYCHSTELTSPGLAPADWQAVCSEWWVFCCCQIRMSTRADSLFKPEPQPTSVLRHPHLSGRAAAPLWGPVICVVPQEVEWLSPNKLNFPPGTEILGFPTVRKAHIQGLAGSEDICFDLNHSSDLQQGLDEEAKPGLAYKPAGLYSLFPPPYCSERGTNNPRLWDLLG